MFYTMIPYTEKYTESESDIQNSDLLYKKDQQCKNTFEKLEKKETFEKVKTIKFLFCNIYIYCIIHILFFFFVNKIGFWDLLYLDNRRAAIWYICDFVYSVYSLPEVADIKMVLMEFQRVDTQKQTQTAASGTARANSNIQYVKSVQDNVLATNIWPHGGTKER